MAGADTEQKEVIHLPEEISKVATDAVFKALPSEVQEKIKGLQFRRDPLNILVIGPTGSGKSRLVNVLLGSFVAKGGRGARSVTTEMNVYKGEFMGVNIRVYDTVGFSDTEGRSDEDIMSEIARMNEFALILICMKMNSQNDANIQKMFTTLSDNMHPDAWKRVVVVLSFADVFIEQENVPPLTPDEEEGAMREEIEVFRKLISAAVRNPAFNNLPFCIAGKLKERRLPTTDDWLADLWMFCLKHFSDEARPLFKAYTAYQAAIHPGTLMASEEETEERIKELHRRGRPVNILVVGRSGVGKSELVNALFGEDVAEVGHGLESVTSEVHAYEGEYKGVMIKVYDTPGFRDSEGKSNHDILLDIAKRGQFDLILLCIKLGDRADRNMFLELASHLHKEMWKRTIVVLTFANQFITLGTVVRNCMGPEAAIREEITKCKAILVGNLSGHVNKEILDNMPYCIAGLVDEMELPTTDDWLKTLWYSCICHCSDETYPFLKDYASQRFRFRHFVYIGAAIGAAIGSIVPVAGTIIGGVAGGVIGGVVGVVRACREPGFNGRLQTIVDFVFRD